MSAVSRTFRAHFSMHSEKSAISLSLKLLLLLCQPRLARNQFRSGTQSDPSISSIATSIMIPTSNSPAKGSGMPNHYVGDLLHTMGMSGLSRVRTELFHLFVVPFLAPHPVHANRQFPRHRHLGDRPSSPHRQVEILTAPLLVTAHRDLRRFHQQESQQRVALLADVSQPPPVPTGFLRRYQAHIAGNLFPAVKPFRCSDHQLERQCRQRTHPRMRHRSEEHTSELQSP